jgi:hypothetical protein
MRTTKRILKVGGIKEVEMKAIVKRITELEKEVLRLKLNIPTPNY